MNKPYKLAITTRRQFIDWLSEEIELPTRQFYPEQGLDQLIGDDAVALIWEGSPEGPNAEHRPIIVVDDTSIRDFLAWTSVYVSSFAPFTAFFRVLSRQEFEGFSQNSGIPDLEYTLLQSLAGVVIAEAVVQVGQTPKSLSTLTIQACQGTFSFAALSALNKGMHPADLSELADAWRRARQIGSDTPLRLDPQDTSTFWMIVAHVLSSGEFQSDSDDTWTGALQDLIIAARFDRPIETSRAWRMVRSELSASAARSLDFNIPREEQLNALDETARSLAVSSLPRPLAEAWLGMLASRLSNGSFDYIGILDSVKDHLPGSLLWFALFSVWRPGFDGLVAGNCLGRRLAREASTKKTLFDLPTYDTTLLEYEVLSDAGSNVKFRSEATAILAVEIRPLVISKFRSAGRGQREDSGDSRALNTTRLRKALLDALAAIEPEERASTFFYDRAPELFDPSPTKKPSRSKRR